MNTASRTASKQGPAGMAALRARLDAAAARVEAEPEAALAAADAALGEAPGVIAAMAKHIAENRA